MQHPETNLNSSTSVVHTDKSCLFDLIDLVSSDVDMHDHGFFGQAVCEDLQLSEETKDSILLSSDPETKSPNPETRKSPTKDSPSVTEESQRRTDNDHMIPLDSTAPEDGDEPKEEDPSASVDASELNGESFSTNLTPAASTVPGKAQDDSYF